jgi:hypothetical protein
MTEAEVRALVQKVLAQRGITPPAAPGLPPGASGQMSAVALYRRHPSHATFTLQVTVEGDAPAPCVIEPGVPCDHCGYCRSYGH